MKKLTITLLLLACIACDSLTNICKESIRLNGEVVYAIPYGPYYRTVTLNIDGKLVKIYMVPKEQPLYNIPVCFHNNRYYWVMP